MAARATLGELDAQGHVAAWRQTRLASFLISAHGAQARLLAAALPGRIDDAWKVEMHGQFCREMEIVSLLARATTWVPDPLLLMLTWQWETAWLPHPASTKDAPEAQAIDAAAFGHALHSAIRPAALLPEGADILDPFVLALNRIELESGRLLQAQALALKAEKLAPVRDAVIAAVDYRHAQMTRLWDELVRTLA